MDAGELNYEITKHILGIRSMLVDGIITPDEAAENLRQDILIAAKVYLGSRELRYQAINDAVGAATCAALEFARRTEEISDWIMHGIGDGIADIYDSIAAPYEDGKIIENGDVFLTFAPYLEKRQ